MSSPQQVIDRLKLEANDSEGGYFANTYDSALKIPNSELPGFACVKNERSLCGAIYYFLDNSTFSTLHKVTGDMLYHFYAGDPVEMLLLYPEGSPSVTVVQLETESSYWRKNTTFEEWQGELERRAVTNNQLNTCKSAQCGEL